MKPVPLTCRMTARVRRRITLGDLVVLTWILIALVVWYVV